MADPLMHTAWVCEECGYMQSHLSRAQSHAPDYCTHCRCDSAWSPKIMGQGQQGGTHEAGEDPLHPTA